MKDTVCCTEEVAESLCLFKEIKTYLKRCLFCYYLKYGYIYMNLIIN